MKKIIFILLILYCFQSLADTEAFKKGNTEYLNENYTSAISIYDSILTQNLESSEIYYNLGNCYYKIQDWGNAIWYYEKSLKLNKSQKTIENINLTKLELIDRIEPLPKLFYKKWYEHLLTLLNTKMWQILIIISIWIILIIKIIESQIKYKNKHLLNCMTIITLCLICITYSSYKENYIKKYAIIFTSSTTVNSAPTNNSSNLFSLHYGSKIQIIDKVDKWTNIKIESGNTGWIENTKYKEL